MVGVEIVRDAWSGDGEEWCSGDNITEASPPLRGEL